MGLCQKYLLILLLLAVPVVGLTQIMDGARVRTLDGDSFEILVNGIKQDEVRLNNIDAPELSQAYGPEAKAALAAIIEVQPIRIVPFGVDQSGRKLAQVWVGGQLVNKALVQAGSAWAFTPMLQDPSYVPLQLSAKAAKIGLWAGPNPVPPWQYHDAARGISAPRNTGNPQSLVSRRQSRPPQTSTFSGRCAGKNIAPK
jgi:micrococcal nuclease